MSAFDTVKKLVQEWTPEPMATELKYRDSLAAFIREKAKGAKVETEYRHNGTTADVYVKESGFFGSSEVFVELKRNLQHKAQFDRLVGQIHELQPKTNYVVVIFCGDTNPALITRFRELFPDSEAMTDFFVGFGTMVFIQKSHSKKAASK
jgi:hypothetical protein